MALEENVAKFLGLLMIYLTQIKEINLKIITIRSTPPNFLDVHLYVSQGETKTFLYNKKNSYNLKVVLFPYKSSTITSKMFFSTISAELL